MMASALQKKAEAMQGRNKALLSMGALAFASILAALMLDRFHLLHHKHRLCGCRHSTKVTCNACGLRFCMALGFQPAVL